MKATCSIETEGVSKYSRIRETMEIRTTIKSIRQIENVTPQKDDTLKVNAYIRMTANSLNNVLVEMTRVAQNVPSDVERMFQTAENGDGVLRPFTKLQFLVLDVIMLTLYPFMMLIDRSSGGVLFKDDDV